MLESGEALLREVETFVVKGDLSARCLIPDGRRTARLKINQYAYSRNSRSVLYCKERKRGSF